MAALRFTLEGFDLFCQLRALSGFVICPFRRLHEGMLFRLEHDRLTLLRHSVIKGSERQNQNQR